jgi:two-component system, cell cycle sensor histidine kinase and response regulator CckA
MKVATPNAATRISPVLAYGAAVMATVVATLLRMVLAPLVGPGVPFATYFLAILFVVWCAGFRAAALTIFLSAVAGTYFFISPATTSPLFLATRTDRVTIVGFVLVSLAVTYLLDLQWRTLERFEREAIRRRDAENAEREQRRWFETTLASIGDAVVATDGEGRVIFMNSVAMGLTGWDLEQARGLPLRNVFHIVNEQTGNEVDSPIDIVIREGATVGLANHTLLISKDGRRIPVDDSGAPIKRDGRALGAVLVFRDVSERRRAQNQIERSEQRYRLLFESNPQPMWVYDRDSLAFLAVNHAAVQQYGYPAEDFLRMSLQDIRPAEDIPALLEDVRQHTEALHRDGPWRHRKRDGSIISVEVAAHPIQFEGRNACLVLASDITERKNLEEQFYQAQRLESVGRLAGGVAHDFNNLLTIINGYADVILSDIRQPGPLRDRLSQISAAGQQAAALTQQLLAFSRRQIVQPQTVNLNQVITGISNMLGRLIGEDIELVIKLAPDLRNIKADVGQLGQILMNLAVNSRDAMPQGGSLIIETGNALLDDEYCAAHQEVRPGAYIMLAVTDTGTGMTPAVKQRIFEPFFTTKPMGSGTGLGLATLHGMVRQSGGWIWVYSEPGSGTTFKIYFPLTEEFVPRPHAVVKSDVRGNETILVVEDQDEVRALAVTVLERYGYRVLSAAGGEEAIALSNSFAGTIHLLLTDVVMPGMNGHVLAKKLSAERGLRVLFMSGYTENAIAHRGVLDAGVDYIQKPFTPESLAEKVREVLGPGELQ